MDFELISGKYKSISQLMWRNIPKFVVVTGKNGSGKTQILELLNFHFGTDHQKQANSQRNSTQPFYGVKTKSKDIEISVKEVVYLSSIWQLGNLGGINSSTFTDIINKLHGQISKRSNTKGYAELAQIVEGAVDKPAEKITVSDVQENLPVDYFDYINKVNIHEGLSEAFLTYHCKSAQRRDEGLSESQIVSALGKAPWDIVNDLLKSADFPYYVNKPKAYMGDFIFQLISRQEESLIINFSDLSSGEKVLISLAIWMFNSSKTRRLPRLILWDEPDAHLHPSAIKKFIDVVERILVGKNGVRVIMTTHSPSTVSLSPEYALFEMSNSLPQISQLKSKEYGINLLTEGMIVVKPNIKYVLVEDDDDAKFYNALFVLLKSKKKVLTTIDIVFISSSNRKNNKSGGCTVVRTWVEKFGSNGTGDIFQGLMDFDNGSNVPESITPTKYLHVIGRYSLENYLLDPILVFASLLHENTILTVPGIKQLTQKDELTIPKFPSAKLQKIADHVLQQIEPTLEAQTDDDKEVSEVSFMSRRKLNYPNWLLKRRGHTLHGKFKMKFKRAVDYDKLINTMLRLEFVPVDLITTLKELQK